MGSSVLSLVSLESELKMLESSMVSLRGLKRLLKTASLWFVILQALAA